MCVCKAIGVQCTFLKCDHSSDIGKILGFYNVENWFISVRNHENTLPGRLYNVQDRLNWTHFFNTFSIEGQSLCTVIVTTQINSSNNLVQLHNCLLTHTTHHTQTFRALPGNLGSWFSVYNLIFTQLEEIWKNKLGSPYTPPPPS